MPQHFEPVPPRLSPTRRRIVRAAATLAGAAVAAPLASRLAIGQPRFAGYPFTLGVASGDPVADGFVIWTRLAPAPLEGGGMPPEVVEVRWEVADDARFLDIVRRGVAIAAPELGHSVHADVTGLEPDRWYFYRFIAGGEASPTGRGRTFPAIDAPKDRLRFAFASCQHYGQGYFTAYDAMMADDLDLIVHLGDYIYESDWGPKVRFHLPEPTTLADYRNVHALYKSDQALQAAHAWHPFLVTWDDHEVDNDYAAGFPEDNGPVDAFLRRRAAAYQAYYEHMPLRRTARPIGPDMRLHTSSSFGDLATFLTLDNRQYRSNQACDGPGDFGGKVIEGCAERTAENRSMLGREQERWVMRELTGAAGTRWKVIAQQMLMAQLEQKAGEGEGWWSDGWDGYPAGRRRLLRHIAESEIADVVVFGGDIHSFWVTDLKADFADPASATVATEFVGTSVTSEGVPQEVFERFLGENPHIRFFDGRHRGYVRVEVTPGSWRTDLRAVSSVTAPHAAARTLRSFIVASGKAGAEAA
jgi:alkaline phosphatase D